MAPRNKSDRASEVPRHLRKDPSKQRQSIANRFNFSWLGGMAQQLRSALSRENKIEARNVGRQSENARRFRESELEARRSTFSLNSDTEEHLNEHLSSQQDETKHVDDSSKNAEVANEDKVVNLQSEFCSSTQDTSRSPGVEPEIQSRDVNNATGINADQDHDLNTVPYRHGEDAHDNLDGEYFITPERDSGGDELLQAHHESSGHEGHGIDDINEENIGDEDVDAEDLDAEDLDAEDLDAEDLDAEDLDAEDLDAEDLDAEDLDADGMDADDVDGKDADAADLDLNLEYAEPVGVNVDDKASLSEDDACAPVEPSDHEAYEYDPELSSMSVWEGAGFDSYDPAMDIEYDQSNSEGNESKARSALNSELDSEPEVERSSSEPPVKQSSMSNRLDLESRDMGSIDPESLDLASVYPNSSLNPESLDSKPLEEPSLDSKLSNENQKHNEKDHKLNAPSQSSQIQPPMIGSRLEPSRRYLGFDFGPALDPLMGSATNVSDSPVTSSTMTRVEAESEKPQAPEFSDKDSKKGDDIVSTVEVSENLKEPEKVLEKDQKQEPPESFQENPYAGLWNLFNVGFTVAPSASPVKEKTPQNPRDSVDPEVSIADEFHLLAQAAHRVMAGSTLFGGSPEKRAPIEMPETTNSPEDQDPAATNWRLSGIAHDLFSNSPLFGGKLKNPVSENPAPQLSENEMQIDEPSHNKQVSDSEEKYEFNKSEPRHLGGLSSGSVVPEENLVDHNIPDVQEKLLDSGKNSSDLAAEKSEENIDNNPIKDSENESLHYDTRNNKKDVDPQAIDVLAQQAEQEPVGSIPHEVEGIPVSSAGLGVDHNSIEHASQETEEKPVKKSRSHKSTEDKLQTMGAKRRRLRNTSTTTSSSTPPPPLAEPHSAFTSETSPYSPSESEEQVLDGSELTKTNKRKRVERTRPLTRAALRAQKEKEALEKTEESESEHERQRERERERERETEPVAKKRKNKSSQKGGSVRRTRNA